MKKLKTHIVEYLEKTSLFEMAYSRKEFKNKVEGSIKQIVENIFMIKLSQDTEKSSQNILHWLQELDAHVSALQEARCEVDKKRPYIEVLDKLEVYNTELVRKWCLKKLKKEQTQYKSDFSNISEKDVEFTIYNYIIKFIYCDIVEIICLPLHIDSENELLLKLNI